MKHQTYNDRVWASAVTAESKDNTMLRHKIRRVRDVVDSLDGDVRQIGIKLCGSVEQNDLNGDTFDMIGRTSQYIANKIRDALE
jgi:hypothetical protein